MNLTDADVVPPAEPTAAELAATARAQIAGGQGNSNEIELLIMVRHCQSGNEHAILDELTAMGLPVEAGLAAIALALRDRGGSSPQVTIYDTCSVTTTLVFNNGSYSRMADRQSRKWSLAHRIAEAGEDKSMFVFE